VFFLLGKRMLPGGLCSLNLNVESTVRVVDRHNVEHRKFIRLEFLLDDRIDNLDRHDR
jgi:hypothetical protein